MTETWTVERAWACECDASTYEDEYPWESELDDIPCPHCGGGPYRLHVSHRYLRDQ
jgi:hypothetical protein